jgi:hypothetical protein
VPGTWIANVTDCDGKLVPSAWSEVGFGDFSDGFVRTAYDHAAEVLAVIAPSASVTAFDRLTWAA